MRSMIYSSAGLLGQGGITTLQTYLAGRLNVKGPKRLQDTGALIVWAFSMRKRCVGECMRACILCKYLGEGFGKDERRVILGDSQAIWE